MTEENELDERVRRLAAEYNAPRDVPREAMWARIVEQRQGRQKREGGRVAGWQRPLWRWGLAAAAVLVVGIVIGRATVPEHGAIPPGPAVTPVAVTPTSGTAFRLVAAEHLDRVETFLAVFQAEAQRGAVDSTAPGAARDLLTDTRLLADSPAGRDPKLKSVLDDVELVLAQIAEYRAGTAGKEDLRFIEQGIHQRGVMLKLSAMTPSTVMGQTAQGAM